MTTDSASPARATATSAGPSTARRRLGLALLVSAQFVVMLDTSIVNVALPSIQADLGLGPADVTWVINAYALAFGGLLLLSGRAADLLGRRLTFVTGSALFVVGTLVCAAAFSPQLLVAGRIIQGIGAAALSPAAMSLLLVMFPGARRATAMSAWGAASTAGGATGVLAGGILSGTLGWPSVFIVTVPISAAAIVFARRTLPAAARGPRPRFDLMGAAAITAAVVCIVQAVLAAARDGWSAPGALGFFTAAVALTMAFIVIERRVAVPIIPLGLFTSRILSSAVLLALLGGAARASTFVLIALYLQQVLGMLPAQAGFSMLPTSLAGFAVSIAVLPRVLRAIGARHSLVIGLVTLAAGHLWIAYVPRDAGYVVTVLPGLLLVAAGVALSFTPTTMLITSAVPATHSGLASGLAGATTQVGAAIGIAIFTAIGMSAQGQSAGSLGAPAFTMAFSAAAVVALVAAGLGMVIASAKR